MSENEFRMAANEAMRAYAKQSILAVTSANSVALLAALSQAETLVGLSPSSAAGAFRYWALGLSLSLVCWVFVILAGSLHINLTLLRRRESPSKTEWIAGIVGMVFFLGAIACFALGCFQLSGIFDAAVSK